MPSSAAQSVTASRLAASLAKSLVTSASGREMRPCFTRSLMVETRTDIAVEAAAKAFHETCREKRQYTWEQSSAEWRRDLRAFVRPIVEAALMASDAYVAAALPKSKTPTDPR